LGCQWLPAPEPGPGDADAAHGGQRQHRVENGDLVTDDDPGEHAEDHRWHVPAPRRAIQHDVHDQQRHLCAKVVWLGEQQVDAVAELRGEHDP
jgi:hypothetical protein